MLGGWILRFFSRLGLGLLLAGFLTLLLVRFAPGFGVDERELDPTLSEATRTRIRNQSSEERSLWRSYANYLQGALHGDLGTSTSLNTPVRELLADRAPVTAKAIAAGLGLAWMIALPLAAIAVIWRAAEIPLLSVNLLLLCLPVGLVAIYFFLMDLPATGVIAAGVGPEVFLYSRQMLTATEHRPHVLGAIARGVRPWRVFWLHRVVPSAPELLALLGVSVTIALGAAIPAEALCDSPGLGQLAWKAAVGRDIAPLLAITWLLTILAFTANALGSAVTNSQRVWRE